MRSGEKLHIELLTYLHSSPNIIQAIKSRRMRWAGHVARMGDTRCAYSVLVEKLEGVTWKTQVKMGG